MNKLGTISRILVAIASLALLAVYFVPAWRIDLFAPQYPEGLVMKIWVHDITGDVEIINGLNHYIGMKHITKDMFPEFQYLPYVVGFFIAVGLLVALTGSRKLLLGYILLTMLGGVAALYDFYQWGYDYGHNLDPTAPIQVPGLSYQPPVVGHKRLLNFDAYSMPDVGGWIVVGAAMIAVAVYVVDLIQRRRNKKASQPAKTKAAAVASILMIVVATGCSTAPEPFELGKDVCDNCRMTIVDPQFGGEVITQKGKLYRFDDVRCMVDFLKSGKVKQDEISRNVVINYANANNFIDAGSAYFIRNSDLKSPMGSNTAAFTSPQEAEKLKIAGENLRWENLKTQSK